jgi:hypothetical protein
MEAKEAEMKEIILTDEQAKLLTEATELVELRDAAGTVLVKIDPIDAMALARHRKRKSIGDTEPLVPAEQVEAYLQRMHEEWDKSGPFDVKRAEEIFGEVSPKVK